jgi:hypothetical protein
MVFVIFHSANSLRQTTWEEVFLRTQLGRYDVLVVDTKPALLQEVADSGVSIDSLYKPGDGHHNNAGNRIIGRALLSALKARPGPRTTASARSPALGE